MHTARVQTRRLFFGDVSIRNSLRSNKRKKKLPPAHAYKYTYNIYRLHMQTGRRTYIQCTCGHADGRFHSNFASNASFSNRHLRVSESQKLKKKNIFQYFPADVFQLFIKYFPPLSTTFNLNFLTPSPQNFTGTGKCLPTNLRQ